MVALIEEATCDLVLEGFGFEQCVIWSGLFSLFWSINGVFLCVGGSLDEGGCV